MLRNALEPWHVAILVLLCLMLFGSKKLPEMARGLGRSARILKAEVRALREEPGGSPSTGREPGGSPSTGREPGGSPSTDREPGGSPSTDR
ncbi:Sec-independent protein translocase subunit TatA [Streptomyces sp. ISL-43]|uniref:Sec-independent protein translocase subunit TatA n=1 Tax=Streptomyces sp. ISL-43 TaxID=2819183 RepID=UPI001BECCCFA|nr:Sec-independent protein translocase subunit TatA [Streptomyces sp. ISL-43]MBT2446690.1 Sec-independent protein translocase subunit TatA [Streptomyces sp. ISL-43]